jgi:hypothetical protein
MKVKSLPIILTFIVVIALLVGSGYFIYQNYLISNGNTNSDSAFSSYVPQNRVIPATPSSHINDYMESTINPNLGNCKVEYFSDEELVPGGYSSTGLDLLRQASGVFDAQGNIRPDRAYMARTVRVEGGICAFALIEEPGNVRSIMFQKKDGKYETLSVD